MNDRYVARLHLRSTIEGVDHRAIEEWCLREQKAGMGWRLNHPPPGPIRWADYEALGGAQDGGVSISVRRLHDLPEHSLLWTRRRDGSYWLGELNGEWEYQHGPETDGLDMFNVRPCRWMYVGAEDAVPGIVVSNFNFGVTLNPVGDAAAVEYTSRLWAQMTGEARDIPGRAPRDVIESLLGAQDVEDLVSTYLQDRHDYVLVSRRRSTVGYEFVLRHRETGGRAVVSVKSGREPIELDRLPTDPRNCRMAVRGQRSSYRHTANRREVDHHG